LPHSNALTPGQISRDHSFPVLPAGNGIDFPIYSLVGGKWTTYRAFAEKVGNEILRVLGRERVRSSADIPIGGGKGYPRIPKGTGLPRERLATLEERYGTGADRVAVYLREGPDAPLVRHPGYSRREIEFLALNERVKHLDDLIMRRTTMGILGEVNGPLLEELAAVVSPALGWSEHQAAAEIERTVELLQKAHGAMAAA
jgi:glycerol-3-phosphate dehydrogenase